MGVIHLGFRPEREVPIWAGFEGERYRPRTPCSRAGWVRWISMPHKTSPLAKVGSHLVGTWIWFYACIG